MEEQKTPIRPLSIRVTEYKKEIQEASIKSQLPLCVIEMILGEMLVAISSASKTAYENDLAEWNNRKDEFNDG